MAGNFRWCKLKYVPSYFQNFTPQYNYVELKMFAVLLFVMLYLIQKILIFPPYENNPLYGS